MTNDNAVAKSVGIGWKVDGWIELPPHEAAANIDSV